MRPNGRRGQVYPLFALFLVPLLAVSALSVDVGYYRYQQRLQQTAADSAAITAALQSQTSGSPSPIASAATTDAAANGFSDGKNGVKITVNSTYSDSFTTNGTGGSTGTSQSGVKVTITKTYGRFFGGFFFKKAPKISTSAVAILKATANGNPCITALGDGGADTDNGAKIVGPNCGLAINGDMTCNGGSIDVATFGVNSANFPPSGCSGVVATPPAASPVPAVPVPDPCKYYSGCLYIESNIDGNGPDSKCASATPGATITGTVTSSFTLGSFTCYNGATLNGVTFGPGVYVIENGAQFQGTNSGNGVVFYINDDVTCACSGGNKDMLDLKSKNPSLNFQAPATSGTTASDGSKGDNYQGVLFYQPGLSGISPGCKNGGGTALNCVEFAGTVGGTCPPGTTGIWYMPHAMFYFNGQNNDCFTGNLIVDHMRENGNGAKVNLYPPVGGSSGQPLLYQAYLVE